MRRGGVLGPMGACPWQPWAEIAGAVGPWSIHAADHLCEPQFTAFHCSRGTVLRGRRPGLLARSSHHVGANQPPVRKAAGLKTTPKGPKH